MTDLELMVAQNSAMKKLREELNSANAKLDSIYEKLKPLQPAQNADEWGSDLIDILIGRLHDIQRINDTANRHRWRE